MVRPSVGTLFLFNFAFSLARAGDINPAPPVFSSATVTTNAEQRIRWTPYPAAEAYTIWSTPDLAQPFTVDLSGNVIGFDWTAALNGPAGFHRVAVTPLSSNALVNATILKRLTYGPTPNDLEHIGTVGADTYIAEQLAFEAIPDTLNTDPPITNTPHEAIKAGHRIDDVGDALPLYDQVWTEVKGGQ